MTVRLSFDHHGDFSIVLDPNRDNREQCVLNGDEVLLSILTQITKDADMTVSERNGARVPVRPFPTSDASDDEGGQQDAINYISLLPRV